MVLIVAYSPAMAGWSNATLVLKLAAGLGFVFAFCLRFTHERSQAFNSLSANAYGMYMVHYVFAVWLQYALLDTRLFATGKAAIVFGGTVIMSWVIAATLRGVPPVSRLNAAYAEHTALKR